MTLRRGEIELNGQRKDDGVDADCGHGDGQEGVLVAEPVVRDSHHRIGHLGPSRQDWRTPSHLFADLNREFGFDIDLAASPDNALCRRYYTEADDALRQPWAPWACYLNPPYARLYPWVQKAYDESRKGATVVMLLPASTDTRWYHDIIQPHAEVRFLRGRLKFEGAQHPATFASMLAIFRPWRVG